MAGRLKSLDRHWKVCGGCGEDSGIIFNYFYCLSCLPITQPIAPITLETEYFKEKLNGAIIIVDEKNQEKLPEPRCKCGGKLDFFRHKLGSKYSNEVKKYEYISKCQDCFNGVSVFKTSIKEHDKLEDIIIILVED